MQYYTPNTFNKTPPGLIILLRPDTARHSAPHSGTCQLRNTSFTSAAVTVHRSHTCNFRVTCIIRARVDTSGDTPCPLHSRSTAAATIRQLYTLGRCCGQKRNKRKWYQQHPSCLKSANHSQLPQSTISSHIHKTQFLPC